MYLGEPTEPKPTRETEINPEEMVGEILDKNETYGLKVGDKIPYPFNEELKSEVIAIGNRVWVFCKPNKLGELRFAIEGTELFEEYLKREGWERWLSSDDKPYAEITGPNGSLIAPIYIIVKK